MKKKPKLKAKSSGKSRKVLAMKTRKPKKKVLRKKIKAIKKIKKKTAVKKKVIIRKKNVTAKKKAEKKKKIVELTPDELRRISKILSRPVIRHMLVNLGGENAIAIVKNFNTGMSDEEISANLKLKISDVRAALNRLHCKGIVAYNREKDSETGWYSYSWYLNREKMEKWADEQLSKFENPSDNGGEHYICPSCGGSVIIPFEDALEKNFRCEICNHALEYIDEKRKEELGIILRMEKGL